MTAAYRFNPAFQSPQGSPIRELFRYTQQPGMISFAGGYPAPALFDTQGLAKSAATLLDSAAAACLQYGATEGAAQLAQVLKQVTRTRIGGADPGDLIVTTGSQQGFELLLRILLEPGDGVVIERPCYPAAIQALRLAHAELLEIPGDAQGMDTDALEALLLAGARPKLLYLVPSFANPTGATLPLVRRRHLLALAVRYQFIVIEDDPYGQLRFSGQAEPPLLQVAQEIEGARDWLVYLSSLSKIVAPGLRIGWMCGPSEILRRAVIAKQTGDLCTAPWMQMVAAQYLQAGHLEAHLPHIIATYRERCAIMLSSLREAFGDRLSLIAPEGGMFIWASWKDGTDATALLRTAVRHNVMYVPGSAFYATPSDPGHWRLSFANAQPQEIIEGVTRLRRAHAEAQQTSS